MRMLVRTAVLSFLGALTWRAMKALALPAILVAIIFIRTPSSSASSMPDLTPAGLQALAECESGGNYSINSGNGFYGAVQWMRGTWRGAAQRAGYSDWASVRPDLVPQEVQDAVTVAHWASSDPSNEWPVCHRSALAAMRANPSSSWGPVIRGHLDRAWHVDEDQIAVGGWSSGDGHVDVHLYAHGPLDVVGIFVASLSPSEYRPDIGDASGWTTVLDIPPGLPFMCAWGVVGDSSRLLGCALIQ